MNDIKTIPIPLVGFSGSDVPDPGTINTCVHCGLCLPACPTYRVTGNELASPRGRIYLMKGVSEGRISLDDDLFLEQTAQCLNCRACEAVCPSGVHYGSILEASRVQVQRYRASGASPGAAASEAKAAFSTPPSHRMPIGERLVRGVVFGVLFKSMLAFRIFSFLMKLYQRIGLQKLVRNSGLLKLLKLEDAEAMLPRISDTFTVPKGQVFASDDAGAPARHRVAVITGCIMSTSFSHVHEATIRVLRKNGCDVILPEGQGCCGALHTHGGDLDGGRSLARANIDSLERLGLDKLDAIIINAAGCGSTLKEYGQLLHDDPAYAARGAAFAAKVRDVHEFLGAITLNKADLKPLPLKVTYQEPCHLAHAQRITSQPRALLKAIPQLTLVEMFESAVCCGSAGIYNVTQPAMAAELGSRKVDNALATGADIIATGNPGCALQLATALRKRGRDVQVKYIVELLDQSYGGADVSAP